MNHDIISLKPYRQLSSTVAAQINAVAGHCFDNQAIHLDFGKLVLTPKFVDELVEITLTHLGIEGTGYVRVKDIERLLGLEVKHLEKEYLEYLISMNLAKEGVQYVRFIDKENQVALPSLMTCIFKCSRIRTTMYLVAELLDLDTEYLQPKPQRLPADLKLSVSWAPFETYLSCDELTTLSSEDVVLVYPK
ncbi:hypothetical protein [Vibrio lentus]|uniref:hypothetical protein n=1 Tax=Vibrio lentus TaxID=136468 RepID=UPI003D134390